MVACSAAETISEIVESLRSRLIAVHIQNLGQKVGSLLTAMVLGEKAVGLDSKLLTDFRNVGLSHVLAASGFNLTVVTFFGALGLPCPVRPGISHQRCEFCNDDCVCTFCWKQLVGCAGQLDVRACYLLQLFRQARPHCRSAWSDASNKRFSRSTVGRRSRFSTFLYRRLRHYFCGCAGAAYLEETIQRRWLRWSLDCLFTVLVAQACVLPLQLFYFKQIGLLFLPANLLASLIVTPVTVSGFTSSLLVILTALCPAGAVFAQPFLWLAALLDWLASIPLNVLVHVVVSLFLAGGHY